MVFLIKIGFVVFSFVKVCLFLCFIMICVLVGIVWWVMLMRFLNYSFWIGFVIIEICVIECWECGVVNCLCDWCVCFDSFKE